MTKKEKEREKKKQEGFLIEKKYMYNYDSNQNDPGTLS